MRIIISLLICAVFVQGKSDWLHSAPKSPVLSDIFLVPQEQKKVKDDSLPEELVLYPDNADDVIYGSPMDKKNEKSQSEGDYELTEDEINAALMEAMAALEYEEDIYDSSPQDVAIDAFLPPPPEFAPPVNLQIHNTFQDIHISAVDDDSSDSSSEMKSRERKEIIDGNRPFPHLAIDPPIKTPKWEAPIMENNDELPPIDEPPHREPSARTEIVEHSIPSYFSFTIDLTHCFVFGGALLLLYWIAKNAFQIMTTPKPRSTISPVDVEQGVKKPLP